MVRHVGRDVLVRRLTSIVLGFVLLPWILPSASATVTAGVTAELVNPEQRVREMSSAVPIFGFGMTSDTAESLHSINITFTGVNFDAGDDRDIAALSTDSATSGIGLYRDSGSQDDVLDPGDTPVTLDGIAWSGTDVRINLTGHNEALPSTTAGNYSWFIVLRSSNNSAFLHDGDRITGRIYTNTILATNAGGLAYQPTADVTTDALVVRLTRGSNLVGGVTDQWIGPGSVEVHQAAPLGLRIVDGGGGVNSGINDWMTGLQLQLTTTSGVITSNDFAPIVPNSASGGVGFYMDDGSTDDVWDANDTAIPFSSISPATFDIVSPVTFDVGFSPAVAVPDDVAGNYNIFVVVRTGTITTGDSFSMRIVPGSIRVSGVVSSDSGHTALFAGWSAASVRLLGDDTPPTFTGVAWSESSYYLGVSGDTLYFNRQMTTNQSAAASGFSADFGGSGTRNVTYSDEPGLAFSPTTSSQARSAGGWAFFGGAYEVNALSTDGDSPLTITAHDWVGNSATADGSGYSLKYAFRDSPILFTATSGWKSAGWPMYIDSAGTLWFGDKIYSTADALLEVTAVSLYGGGIKSISASPEPSLGGPSNPNDMFGPGIMSATFDSSFTFWGNSSTDGAVTVTAVDQSLNSASVDLQVRKDTSPPLITILAPTGVNPLTGLFRIIANVTDAGAGVSWVEAGIDPNNGSNTMVFDGTNWYLDVSSNTFSDGPHSIVVQASDRLNNQRAATLNVMFGNGVFDSVPPRVSVVGPSDGSLTDGTVMVTALASDNAAVASVWVQVGAGAPVQAAFNAATGYYEYAWDSSGAPDGTAKITVTALDTFGNQASASVSIRIDNTPPRASISGPAPGAQVAGTSIVRVFASDAGGVQSVVVTIDGRAVDLAYNPSTGYYEYTLDTTTLKDGTHSLSATVTDANGHATSTQAVEFKVQNGDTWKGVRESTNFLFLLFAIVVVAAVLVLARRGVIRRWMTSDAAVDRRLKDEDDRDKRKRDQSP